MYSKRIITLLELLEDEPTYIRKEFLVTLKDSGQIALKHKFSAREAW